MAGISEKQLTLILKAQDQGLKKGLKDVKQRLSELAQESKKTNQSLKNFSTQNKTTASGLKTLGGNARSAAGHLMGLAAAYGAFRGAKAAVSAVVEFNQSLAEVSTLSNASQADISALGDHIIQLSTEIPQTAAELTAAEYDIISAGVALGDSTKVLEMSAKAAIAGVTDTKTAVEAGVGVMNAYGKGVDDLGGIYDTLFQTVKLGVVHFEDLAQNMGKVTPIAAAAGVNFKQLSAAIGTLTKGGMKADIATTGLRGAIVALSSPAAAAKKKMEELGISWTTLEGTIKQIADKNLGVEVMREIIPDVRARTAVLSLAKNYGTLSDTLEQMNNAAGSTEAAYKKMAESIANQFKLLKNEITAAILKNKDFVESLHTLADSSTGVAQGIGTLASNILTLGANVTTGWAGLVSYHTAMWDLNEATLAVDEAQGKWQGKLDEVNAATGLNITSSKELIGLVKEGVISYDELTGELIVNTTNLALHKDGMIEVGVAYKDYVPLADATVTALEDVGQAAEDAAAKFVQSVSDMGGVADEIVQINQKIADAAAQAEKDVSNSYEVRAANLQAALDKELITQTQFNEKSLALEKEHQQAIVAEKKAGLDAAKKALEEGTGSTDAYKQAVLDLKAAEHDLATTEGKAAAAIKDTGNAATDAGGKLKAAGQAGVAAAQTAESSWQAFGQTITAVAGSWDAAIKTSMARMKRAKEIMDSWREQTKRTEFSSSAQANIDKFKGADFNQIQDEINRQQKIVYSMSIWVSPEQKKNAQDTIKGLTELQQELLTQKNTIDENTSALDQNTSALNNCQPGTGFATGGRVPGTGNRDTVPAMLTPGEFVIRKQIVEKLSPDFFNRLNRGFLPGYNLGGLIGKLTPPRISLPDIQIPNIQHFASGGQVQPGATGETYNLNLSLNGASSTGVFPKTPETQDFLNELALAEMASR